MDLDKLKKRLINTLVDELEEITGNLLIEAEDEKGTDFTIQIGNKKINIAMKTSAKEEENEYTEEYFIKH